MSNNWKFEPDPITRGYINKLDKSPVDFQRIELIRKEVEEKLKNYNLVSDYKERDEAYKCWDLDGRKCSWTQVYDEDLEDGSFYKRFKTMEYFG